MRKTFTAAVVAATLLFLVACGNDQDGDTTAGHNDADVTFAQQMIPHHRQAIEMSELAQTRAHSQEVKDLAADIEAAQGPEIETMTGWLESWDEEVPDNDMPGMDHGEMSEGMPGMMSGEDMGMLDNASGPRFDRMFLTMMIEHHEGAIVMARTEQAEGEFPDAKAMAAEIEVTQAEEIELMRELLAS